MADISEWDPVDDGNTDAPPNGWPEFMQPSAVNNAARAMMGAIRRWYDTVTAQLAGVAATLATKVSRSGDLMTGPLTVTSPDGQVVLSKPIGSGGQAASIFGETNGVLRWVMALGANDPEAGGNSGSSFALHRYADNGSFLGTVVTGNRQTGVMTFSGAVSLSTGGTAADHATRKDYVDSRDTAIFNAANNYATQLDTNQKDYIDNRDNIVLSTAETKVAKTGDTMSGNLSVPRILGGPFNAGTLQCHSSTDTVCFRNSSTRLEYRINEAIARTIADTVNFFDISVETGAGPLGLYLRGNDNVTWFHFYADATTPSDERAKLNITASEIDALGLLNQVQLNQFDYKPEVVGLYRSVGKTPEERERIVREAQPEHVDIGFVAQQVRGVIPDAVFSAGQPSLSPDSPLPADMLSINNQAFVPYLVRAVQQLSARVAALEGR